MPLLPSSSPALPVDGLREDPRTQPILPSSSPAYSLLQPSSPALPLLPSSPALPVGSLFSDDHLPDNSHSSANTSSDSLPDLEGDLADRLFNPPSEIPVTPRSFPVTSAKTPVSSRPLQTREAHKKTPASVPVVGAKVLAWTTGKTGGPGKQDSFKVPKKVTTPTKKAAVKSKKKTVSKYVATTSTAKEGESREENFWFGEQEAREEVLMPVQARTDRAEARTAVKRPLFSSSPTTVVKRIAVQASKQRYQATLAHERPSLLASSPSPVSPPHSVPHLQPGPSTAPVNVHARNCRYIYCTKQSNDSPPSAVLHF